MSGLTVEQVREIVLEELAALGASPFNSEERAEQWQRLAIQSANLAERAEAVFQRLNGRKHVHEGVHRGLSGSDSVAAVDEGLNVVDEAASFLGVDGHSSSPVVADAGAATPVDPALTVQENTSGASPAAGVAGACECAAPANTSHGKTGSP